MGYRPNRKRVDDWLSRLKPTAFETLLADYFRDKGYRVEHVGAQARGQRFDGGIDLKLHRDNDYIIVQCKNWKASQVTHNAMHELLGVMLTQRATGAVVVTSGEFSAHAITSAAEDRRMRLIDGVELRRLLAEWPARERWARTGAGSFSNVFAGVRRAARFALAALALLFVGLVALAVFSSRKPAKTTTGATVATTSDAMRGLGMARRARPPDATPTPAAPASSSTSRRASRASVSHAVTSTGREFATTTMPIVDRNRRVDPESARLAARRIAGVRSAVWMDDTYLIVRVHSAEQRSMAMIDQVCDALEPLGNTLGVVVALQNANARNGDEMQTLMRNCQLAEGQRAFLQRKREIDTVSPELRAQFKAMQERNQPQH